MALGGPEQNFPSRAALRRARQAEEEALRRGRDADLVHRAELRRADLAPAVPAAGPSAGPGELDEFDEFDAIEESRPEDGEAWSSSWIVPVDVPGKRDNESAAADRGDDEAAVSGRDDDEAAPVAGHGDDEAAAVAGHGDDDAAAAGRTGDGGDPAVPAPSPRGSAATGSAAPATIAPAGGASASADARRRALRGASPALDSRETFLRPEDAPDLPPQQGMRGLLARVGFSVQPSAQELQERKWRRAIAAPLPRARTVSVVNGKGGANKTPTAVLLGAAFGRHSGETVLVWDNNGTRGTLGWRTVDAGHPRHSMDLLAVAPELAEAKAGDRRIDEYVHYQPEDRFSVLRTDPRLLAHEQHLDAGGFDTLHAAASRYFRLTVVDSGNDESAERWLRMIDHTDQLVIASTTVEEHAEAGALLLEALAARGGHYAELARNAVVVVSQHQQRGGGDQLSRIADGFRRLSRAVVTIPYDPALVKGPIRFDALRPGTRRAWLEAAAAVAAGLD